MVLPGAVLILQLVNVAVNPPFSADWVWFALGVIVFVALVVAGGTRFQGVTLKDAELVVRVFRTRHIPWSQVQAVSQQSQMGSRWVVLSLADRKSVRLPAPRVAWPARGKAKYDEQYHLIGQWWLEHRGAGWRPAC
jgi:hypothetical protein